MNTKNQLDQKKNQRQKTRQQQGPKRQGRTSNMLHVERKHNYHEHELPETRMTD
jgi:hypothetical protein